MLIQAEISVYWISYLEEIPIPHISSIQTKIFGRQKPKVMKLEKQSIPKHSKK